MKWGISLRLILLGMLINLLSIAFILQTQTGSWIAVAGSILSLLAFFKTEKEINLRLFLFGVNIILLSIAMILESGIGVNLAFAGLVISIFSLIKFKSKETVN